MVDPRRAPGRGRAQHKGARTGGPSGGKLLDAVSLGARRRASCWSGSRSARWRPIGDQLAGRTHSRRARRVLGDGDYLRRSLRQRAHLVGSPLNVGELTSSIFMTTPVMRASSKPIWRHVSVNG